MGTSFEKKPIKPNELDINNQLSNTETMPQTNMSEIYVPENDIKAFSKKKNGDNNQSDQLNNNSQNKITEDSKMLESEEIIKIDVELITKKIQDILKSPSPMTLYSKSAELKEDFSKFINYLVKKIALGFSSENKTDIIIGIYQKAKYEQIWFNNLKTYLDEAKYFDVRMYFNAITKFDKEKQYIAKALLKIKGNVVDKEIEKYLKKYDAKIRLSQVKAIYKTLNLDDIIITDPKYLNENKIDIFLENIYFNTNDLGMLFQIFCFDTDKMKGKFKDIYEIFSEVARSYLKNISPKTKLIYEYLENDDNKKIVKNIDKYILEYPKIKREFYRYIASEMAGKNSIERGYFWSYVKTKMIDTYFSEVESLFYWDKDACSNRNEWANLKGNFLFSQNAKYEPEIKEILQFKKLILELNTNIFAPFLKPLVYSIVSEKLSITRKELLKIRYLMTLVLSENYQEYKKIYNFFEDLEAFMDYKTTSFLGFNFGKIKIFAADILLGFVGLVWLYFYSPVGVFVSSLVLSISYIRTHFFKFNSGIEWNLGVKPVATVILVISSFYWITNLDTTKIDIAKLSSKVEKMGIYKTDVATKVAIKKLNESGIKQAVADILQSKK